VGVTRAEEERAAILLRRAKRGLPLTAAEEYPLVDAGLLRELRVHPHVEVTPEGQAVIDADERELRWAEARDERGGW
jgi:hypothetical protein